MMHAALNPTSVAPRPGVSLSADDREIRTRLQVRSYKTSAILEKRSVGPIGSITGILAPYNSLSCDLGGFRETYQPGCFNEFLESGEDALVLGFHNPENVLGRRSQGSALLWEELDGLHFEADLPDTLFARDLRTLMERGDVNCSSAAFYILQHHWEQRSSGRVRIVEKASLVEGSVVSLGAYSTASCEFSQKEIASACERGIRLIR
jgi:HK97 family phage prohead protease